MNGDEGALGSALGSVLSEVLKRRLDVVAAGLGVEGSALAPSPADALAQLASAVAQQPDDGRLWRLLVALTGSYPGASTLLHSRRRMRLAEPGQEWIALLHAIADVGDTRFDLHREAQLVSGAVIADVDFCAKRVFNTGIQRVVRQTMRRWQLDRPVTFAAWTDGDRALRHLTGDETSRVVSWGGHAEAVDTDDAQMPLLIPTGCVVVLPEVSQLSLCPPLEGLARFSANPVAAVGYDVIPITSADTVSAAESEKFTQYLAVLKSTSLVAGISQTAAQEFRGYANAVRAQGVAGPDVIGVLLPVDRPDGHENPSGTPDGPPLVLVVGSHEPRKNHEAVLASAEELWREGLTFRLRFIGGGSPELTKPFDARIRRLSRQGFPVEALRGVSDRVLTASYTQARCSVFPSLHEGFGLPVAESLAYGVPCVTTCYGSTGEIAAGGGCLVVDPRSDAELTEALRSMLLDEVLYARLLVECADRPIRTWVDYANDLWVEAVEPLRLRVGA